MGDAPSVHALEAKAHASNLGHLWGLLASDAERKVYLGWSTEGAIGASCAESRWEEGRWAQLPPPQTQVFVWRPFN